MIITKDLTIKEIVLVQDLLGMVIDELETERRKKIKKFKPKNVRRVKFVV